MSSGPEGLEGVIAAETVLSEVDGDAGRLVIRGLDLSQVCGRMSFEAAVRLLWGGFFDRLPVDLAPALGAARARVFSQVAALDAVLIGREPIEAVRALIARLPDGDDLDTALDLVAAPAVFTAAVTRAGRGDTPLAPDATLGHAADILRMIEGTAPSADAAWALDAYLATVMDHGLNASTFAARVAASTRPGLTSAVLAGLSTLKGPLHGGAPGPVIDMLDEIGEPAGARAWLESALDRGDRLMGFGHRIYRVRDPRADALKAVVARLNQSSNAWPGRLELAEAVEAAALAVLRERKPGRSLDVNVELYTALLLEALSFPRDAFTCVFAMGRTAGWLAHAREQVATGRIVRPQSTYVGPKASLAA